jgi:hypothetical protein
MWSWRVNESNDWRFDKGTEDEGNPIPNYRCIDLISLSLFASPMEISLTSNIVIVFLGSSYTVHQNPTNWKYRNQEYRETFHYDDVTRHHWHNWNWCVCSTHWSPLTILSHLCKKDGLSTFTSHSDAFRFREGLLSRRNSRNNQLNSHVPSELVRPSHALIDFEGITRPSPASKELIHYNVLIASFPGSATGGEWLYKDADCGPGGLWISRNWQRFESWDSTTVYLLEIKVRHCPWFQNLLL